MPSKHDEPQLATQAGRRLRLARTALQMTQADFAAKAGLRPTAVGNYEQGHRLIPPAAAIALCEAWGLTLDFIYTGEMGNMRYDLASAIRSLMDLEGTCPDTPRAKPRTRPR